MSRDSEPVLAPLRLLLNLSRPPVAKSQMKSRALAVAQKRLEITRLKKQRRKKKTKNVRGKRQQISAKDAQKGAAERVS